MHVTCATNMLVTPTLVQHARYIHVTCATNMHVTHACYLTLVQHAWYIPTPVQHACNTHVTGVLHAC